jgi:hypothetical protein
MKNSNELGFKYLVISHIPIKNYGYLIFENLRNESESQYIQKKLEFNLRKLSEIDSEGHLIEEIQIIDNKLFNISFSHFSITHSDEYDRKGIFFSIHLIVNCSDLYTKLDKLLHIVKSNFLKIEIVHPSLKESKYSNSQKIYDYKKLIDLMLTEINELIFNETYNYHDTDDNDGQQTDDFYEKKEKNGIKWLWNFLRKK